VLSLLLLNVMLTNVTEWCLVAIGTASEDLNNWADEDAGIEAVQKILDTLDDVAALQDDDIDPDVLISMLRDAKLHAMLQVRSDSWIKLRELDWKLSFLLAVHGNVYLHHHFLSLFLLLFSSVIRSHQFPSDVTIKSATR